MAATQYSRVTLKQMRTYAVQWRTMEILYIVKSQHLQQQHRDGILGQMDQPLTISDADGSLAKLNQQQASGLRRSRQDVLDLS